MCDDGAALLETAESFWPFLAGFFLAATLFAVWRAEKLAGQEQQQREEPVGKIVSPMWWKNQAAPTVSARRTAEPLQVRKPRMQDGSRRAGPLQSERASPDHARERRPASKCPPASSGPGFTRKSSRAASSAQDLPRKSSPQPASARRASCPEASRSWGSFASSSSRNSREDADHASRATTPDVRTRASNGMESRPADLRLQIARGVCAWQDAKRAEQRAGPGEPHSSLLDAALLRYQQERRYSWEPDESDADDLDDHFIRSKPAGLKPAKQDGLSGTCCFLEQEGKGWAPHAVRAPRQMHEKLCSVY
jgi:hypothetical protein